MSQAQVAAPIRAGDRPPRAAAPRAPQPLVTRGRVERVQKIGFFKWIGILGIHFFFLFLFGIINFTSAIMATIARNKARDAKVASAIKKLELLVKMYWSLVAVYFVGFFIIVFFGWALGFLVFIVEYILILIELGQLAVFGVGAYYSFSAMAEISDSASFKAGDGAAKAAHKQARSIGILSLVMFVLTSFYLVYVFRDLYKTGGIEGRLKLQAGVAVEVAEAAGFPEAAALKTVAGGEVALGGAQLAEQLFRPAARVAAPVVAPRGA